MAIDRGGWLGVFLIVWLGALPAQAEGTTSSKPRDATPQRQTLKPPTPASCAQYGPGFVRVEGSDTCVKIGGAVSVGVGVSR